MSNKLFTVTDRHNLTQELLDVLNARLKDWRTRIDGTVEQDEQLGSALMDTLTNTLANVFLSITNKPDEAARLFCINLMGWFQQYLQDHHRNPDDLTH